MYELIENLNKDEFEQFVFNNQKSHFLQSYYWGNVAMHKHFFPYYIGLKKDNILVGTALLLEKKVLKNIGYIYCPRGFITDYNDFNTVKEFTKLLKIFTKKHNDMFLKIDPDIKLQNLDNDGNIIGEENNFKLVDNLIKLGFKHKGFNKNFENSQPRYTYRLNIDKDIETIKKGFHPSTRCILNKENPYDLDIYLGDESDILAFYTTMQETAKRENIIQSDITYYKNFYSILNKKNMSDIYVVKANIESLKDNYNNKIMTSKKEIEAINNNKKKNINKTNNLINDLNNKINKLTNELKEIEQIKEKEIVLSSIITVKYHDLIWTVHGGNHSLLRFINANYFLYYKIIKDANIQGYKTFDFFGTTGNPIPSNPLYGIHLFKKRFGGEYMEFIGEFDLVTKKFFYYSYNFFIKLRNIKKLLKSKQ